jgi:DNA polymerase III gamma/tau subunit
MIRPGSSPGAKGLNVDFGVGAYLLPAALVFGAPANPGTYEKGLFCESLELIERVAGFAERGANPLRVVADINARLTHTACIYTTKPDVRARTVRFEKTVAANHTTYSVYQVQVTAHGVQKTEIGDIEWTFSPPLTMYTLRAAAPTQTVSH